MAVIIELIGIPGSGKSALSKALAEEFEARGRVVHRRVPPSALHKVRAAAAHVGVLAAATKVLARSSRPMGDKFAALRFLVVMLERYQVARSDHSTDVYVFDEGSIQRAFMIFVEDDGVRTDGMDAYVRSVPAADVIIWVTAPSPAEALQRVHDRPRGLPTRLAGLPDDRAEAILAEADEMLGRAARTAAEHHTDPPCTVVGPVASDDTAPVLAQVAPIAAPE